MSLNIIYDTPLKKADLSIAGIEIVEPDPFNEEVQDEFCCLTHDDTYFYVDDDDPFDDLNPERLLGVGIRWSDARPFEFWTYYNRFVKYWPRKKFHVKYGYEKGFVEKKRKGSDRSLPLFDSYAIELTERHLDADSWAEWKKRQGRIDPIWLGLHMPKLTTVDAIDIDAKKYLLGYYRTGSSNQGPLQPVVHLPLEHFKLLKRVYDQFPDRIWCISSETLGIHVWKKHECPQSSVAIHKNNKAKLSAIGLGHVESHPMLGRCFRRPFGADYRTITPDGFETHWIYQLNYFENDGRTPDFSTICHELLNAMSAQWKNWTNYGSHDGKKYPRFELEKYQHELTEVQQWLNAGCPLESLKGPEVARKLDEAPQIEPTPLLNLCREMLLVTFGEKNEDSLEPLLKSFTESANKSLAENHCNSESTSKAGNKRNDLASLRHGNWAKELLRLAHVGLEEEDSVATVVHEMAKWLWWIELYSRPEASRRKEIISLLTNFVLQKHNGFVTRLINGHRQDVINQIVRCVDLAASVSDPENFAVTRQKWLNGGYTFPIRIIPALSNQSFTDVASLRSDKIDETCGSANQVTFPLRSSVSKVKDKEDDSLSSSCLFTVMCIKFGKELPYQVQDRIKAKAGRNKILPFATRLLNRLYSKNGSEYLGRPILLQLLGYNNPNQIGKYLTILGKAGVIKRGQSYSKGRNGKLITLAPSVMQELETAGISQAEVESVKKD